MATAEQHEKWAIYAERDWQVTIEMFGTAQGRATRTFIIEACRIDRAIEVAVERMVDNCCQPDEDGEVFATVSSISVVPSPTLIRRHEWSDPT
jgi:hypothetical protein